MAAVGLVIPTSAAAQPALIGRSKEPIRGAEPMVGSNEIHPEQFFVDPPTLENLGFRWYVSGDRNRNATVDVAFRKPGEDAWTEALPLLRNGYEISNQDYQPYRVGNLFAGSVLFLQPATEYEVRFTMTDPDGGAPPQPKVVRVATRDEPTAAGGRVIEASAQTGLMAAYQTARPGDTILLQAGVYQGPFEFRKSGQPGRPIVFRGPADGKAILQADGPEGRTRIVSIGGSHHLMFENLTFRQAHTAIYSGKPGSVGITVRRCRIENVIRGINTEAADSRAWYIADNDIEGINPSWYPRPRETYMSPAHTGVNVYGQGHVVCYNRISRFSDSLAIANFGPPVDDPERHCVAIDFYGNDLSWAQDDTIEADYGCHNVRIYRNRCYNTHTALSTQPFYGGPVYLIRNEAYGITALNLKLNNYPAGILVYNNTLCCARQGLSPPPIWQNGHFRNNLFMGGDGYAMETGSPTTYSTLDYNGYRRNSAERFLKWTGPTRRDVGRFQSLAELTRATGLERHGLEVDYDNFVKAGPPEEGHAYAPADYDLRLTPHANCIDAGTPIPRVTDNFSGAGPDLGCHESGQELPHYGPRKPQQVNSKLHNDTAADSDTSLLNSGDPSKDAIGDPLPKRAVIRFGTHRFQHPDSVNTMVVAPDDSYVLSMNASYLIAWEASTGKELWRKRWPGSRISGHAYGQRFICFAGDDSSRFFTPGQGQSVLQWDPATGDSQSIALKHDVAGFAPVGRASVGNTSLDVSVDGESFLLGGASGLGLYARTGEELWFIANQPKVPIQIGGSRDRLEFGGDYATAQLSPDGSIIAAALSESRTSIRLLEPATGKSTGQIETTDRMVRMTFSGDGKSLFTTERDCGIRRYSLSSRQLDWEFALDPDPQGAESYASAITCSSDGQMIAAGVPIGPKYWIYLIDAKTGQQKSILKSDMWKPWAVQFADGDEVLFSSGWDASIRRWDVATGAELPLPVGVRASSTVTLSADGRQAAFRDGTGDVRVLRSQTGQQRLKIPAGGASAILFAPDSNRLFLGGNVEDELQVRIWDLVEDRSAQTWRWPLGKDPHSDIEELATDSEGRYLAAVSFRQDMAYLWRTDSGEQVAEYPHQDAYGLALSADGTVLVTAGWDKQIRVWEVETGKLLQAVNVEDAINDPQLAGGDARMYGVRFSPDAKRIAACHMDGTVSVWDASQPDHLKPLFHFPTGRRFTFGALDYSSNGCWIACGDGTGNVLLFDARNGEKMVDIGKHEDHIYTVRFGGEGSRLVSGGGGVAYLWALDDPGQAAELEPADLWMRLRDSPAQTDRPIANPQPDSITVYDTIIAIAQSDEACSFVIERLQKLEAVMDTETLNSRLQGSPALAAFLRKANEDDSFEFNRTVYRALLALKLSKFPKAKQAFDSIAESHPSEPVRKLARELR